MGLIAASLPLAIGCGRERETGPRPSLCDWAPAKPLELSFGSLFDPGYTSADKGVPERWDSIVVRIFDDVYTHVDDEENFLLAIEGGALRKWDCNANEVSTLSLRGLEPLMLVAAAESSALYKAHDGRLWLVNLTDGTCSELPVEPLAWAWGRIIDDSVSLLAIRYSGKPGLKPLVNVARFRQGQLRQESPAAEFESVYGVVWDNKGERVLWDGVDWATYSNHDPLDPAHAPGGGIWCWQLGQRRPEELLRTLSAGDVLGYIGWTPKGKMLFEMCGGGGAMGELISELYSARTNPPPC